MITLEEELESNVELVFTERRIVESVCFFIIIITEEEEEEEGWWLLEEDEDEFSWRRIEVELIISVWDDEERGIILSVVPV